MSSSPVNPGVPATAADSRRLTDSFGSRCAKVDISVNGVVDKEKIRKLFEKVELSASAYDTARVAMVPSLVSPQAPCFPGCLNWVLENQRRDGSWSLQSPGGGNGRDPLLGKDTLSSTLACLLALKRWGVADEQVHAAIAYVERNSGVLADPSQRTPVGFDVIFPAMVETCARDFDLNLTLKGVNVESLLSSSASASAQGRDAYLAYVAEGVGGSQEFWRSSVVKFQRKNGSLFNSPSATAAAFTHLRDPNSLRYLLSLTAGNNFITNKATAVPAIYPYEIHARLSLVDGIESLGIDRHFHNEITEALDKIHRRWLQEGDEEIFLDVTTCAMAFRILCLHGYPVSPEALRRFTEERFWTETMEGYSKDERAVMELHKASRIMCHDSPLLESLRSWTGRFLQQKSKLAAEVESVVNRPFYTDWELPAYKRNIEQYCNSTSTRLLKSSFSSLSFDGEQFLTLAVEDFNSRQSTYLRELEHLMLWLKEQNLDDLRMAKVKIRFIHFHAASAVCDPRLSDARVHFVKHGFLITLVDDLFDIYGTPEEQLNLIHLLERWGVNEPSSNEFSSKHVKKFYWAIRNTIFETVDKALPIQGRDITNQLVQLWVDVLKAMRKEAEWSSPDAAVPTLDEYMAAASVSVGLQAILTVAIYLTGHQLEERVFSDPESDLCKLLKTTSACARLLNDCRGFGREAAQGKANAVSLRRPMTVEDAMEEVESLVERLTREVLRLANVKDDDEEAGGGAAAVPREVRDMVWRSTKGVFLFYMNEDLFHASTDLVEVMESVINQPIRLPSAICYK